MHAAPFSRVADEEILRAMVRVAGSAWLVSTGDNATPSATLVPILWQAESVVACMSRTNPQWRTFGEGHPALLICPGPDAYVSPGWIPRRPTNGGRVVPTWSYTAVHLTGIVQARHDPAWISVAIRQLAKLQPGGRDRMADAHDTSEDRLRGSLRGIVGLDMAVTGIEGKSKRGQAVQTKRHAAGPLSDLRLGFVAT